MFLPFSSVWRRFRQHLDIRESEVYRFLNRGMFYRYTFDLAYQTDDESNLFDGKRGWGVRGRELKCPCCLGQCILAIEKNYFSCVESRTMKVSNCFLKPSQPCQFYQNNHTLVHELIESNKQLNVIEKNKHYQYSVNYNLLKQTKKQTEQTNKERNEPHGFLWENRYIIMRNTFKNTLKDFFL